jgi:soluble lytic murein transglycosylase
MARTDLALIRAMLLACSLAPLVGGASNSAEDGRVLASFDPSDAFLTDPLTAPAPIPAVVSTSQPILPAPSALAVAPPASAAAPVTPASPEAAPPPAADLAASLPSGIDIAAVRSAIELYRKGDLAGGDAAAAAIADPTARAALEWAAVRFAWRDMGFRRLQAFLDSRPDWPMQSWVRKRCEEALVQTRPAAPVVRAYFAAHPPKTVAGKIALAKALVEAEKMTEAARLVRDTWRNDSFGSDTESRIIEAFPELIEAADHRARATRLLYEEEWTAALRSATKAGPDFAKLAKARVDAARSPSKAAALLEAVPKPLRADPVWVFAKAQALRKSEKFVDAAKAMAGLTRDPASLVDPEAWWTERRLLARKLLDAGEQKLAYEVARGAPADGKTATRIDAEFHAGWIALRFLNDLPAARHHFAEAAALASTPMSISRAAYWQGRAEEAAGRPAEEFYQRAADQPTTYYGQLARAKLVMRELPVRRVRHAQLPSFEGTPLTRAVRLLYAAGARDLAVPLLTDTAQRLDDPGLLDALAGIAAEQGDVRAILSLGKFAGQRGLALDDHAFPTGGVPSFPVPDKAVERPLVFAIARQESSFDPSVVSPAGARGLMQLMPATARMTAQRAGLGFELGKLTEDPAYNARLGATHLVDLMADWKGSYILAIAAYNAGGGNVKKWIEAYGDPRSSAVDPVDWVERIPFTETRNYVQRVLENLQVYRVRLGDSAVLQIDADLKRGVAR